MTNEQCNTRSNVSEHWEWGALDLPDRPEILLKNNVLFEDLDTQTLKRIAARCGWSRFGPDRQIVGQSDATTDVFLIAQGHIRVKSFSSTGKEVTYLDMAEGQFFGEFSAIDGESRSATVLTLSDCLIGRLTSKDFIDVLVNNPSVSQKLLKHLVGKARQLTDRIFEFSTLAVRNRLHCELLRMAGESGENNVATISPAPTHYELATRISTHREAVTRELKYLTAEGLVEIKRGTITILDVDRLHQMVQRIAGF